jgi:hypothetical protein
VMTKKRKSPPHGGSFSRHTHFSMTSIATQSQPSTQRDPQARYPPHKREHAPSRVP